MSGMWLQNSYTTIPCLNKFQGSTGDHGRFQHSLLRSPKQGDTFSGGRYLVSNWRPVDWRKHSCPSLSEELDQFVNEWQ